MGGNMFTKACRRPKEVRSEPKIVKAPEECKVGIQHAEKQLQLLVDVPMVGDAGVPTMRRLRVAEGEKHRPERRRRAQTLSPSWI